MSDAHSRSAAASKSDLELDVAGDAPRSTGTSSRGPSLHGGDEALYPSKRKRWAVLGIFALSVFVDILGSSAFFVFTGEIASDLGILFEQQSWIITAYSATFASFLLFFGRVSDVFAAEPVFDYGFALVALLNLVLSFVTDKYAFFVLRALAGIAGASVVPSAYRLIAHLFPPDERQRAFTLYGMTGSIANVTGVIIAGAISAIPNGGQMRSWRWFFRIVAAICTPTAIASFLLLPWPKHTPAVDRRLRRLDLPGVLLVLPGILLLILGLTLGASYGWARPGFYVPLVLSALLLVGFFLWEARQPSPEDFALIPPSLWRIPNFTMFITFGLLILGWWAVNFIPFIQLFYEVHGESVLKAAVRTLPEGIAAGAVSVVMVRYPHLNARPRWPIILALLLCTAAYALWTQARDLTGTGYWAYVFPGMLIGSGGMQVVLLSTIVGVMQSAPPHASGVVGAVLQTSMQSSTVVALSIQAGLLTVAPGGLNDFANVRASWYFELGWTALWLVGFVAWYREPKLESESGSEAKAETGAEAEGGTEMEAGAGSGAGTRARGTGMETGGWP